MIRVFASQLIQEKCLNEKEELLVVPFCVSVRLGTERAHAEVFRENLKAMDEALIDNLMLHQQQIACMFVVGDI